MFLQSFTVIFKMYCYVTNFTQRRSAFLEWDGRNKKNRIHRCNEGATRQQQICINLKWIFKKNPYLLTSFFPTSSFSLFLTLPHQSSRTWVLNWESHWVMGMLNGSLTFTHSESIWESRPTNGNGNCHWLMSPAEFKLVTHLQLLRAARKAKTDRI